MDNTALSSREMRLFERYALETAGEYCAGCSGICQAAVQDRVPIADIMRYHMYSHTYGQLDWARKHFQTLPGRVRRDMAQIDFSEAQRQCPRNMPIARLIEKALRDFA